MQSTNQPDLYSYISDTGYIDPDNELKVIQLLKEKHVHSKNKMNHDRIIHIAVRSGLIKLTEKLLELGADCYAINKANENALSIACKENHTDIIELILADPSKITFDVGYNIFYLVKDENLDLLKRIFRSVDYGFIAYAMEPVRLEDQNTILHYAALYSDSEMIKLLMDNGADPECKNINGKTPIDFAAETKNESALEILKRKKVFRLEPSLDENESQLESDEDSLIENVSETTSSRAMQNWNNFQGQISKRNIKSFELRGRLFSNPYQHLLTFVMSKIPSIQFSNLDALGEVEKYNDAYYFKQSKESMDCAANFLNSFWEKPGMTDFVINHHKLKCKGYNNQTRSFYPRCISFIIAVIDDKKYCFISLSGGRNNNSLLGKVKKFTEDYNKNPAVPIEFIVMNRNFMEYQKMIVDLTGDQNSKKECAEMAYLKGLTKLFLEYGNKMQVTGVANCAFYPYQNNKIYGMCDGSIDRLVRPYKNDKYILPLSENRIARFIPCCLQCRANKFSLISLLAVSQNYGSGFYKEKIRELSPIRNTFGNFTESLLNTKM